MKPKFRTPTEVAGIEHREKFTLLVPRKHLEYLRREAAEENITTAALINEAIRAYVEYLKEEKKS